MQHIQLAGIKNQEPKLKNRKYKSILFFCLILISHILTLTSVKAQNSVGIGTTTPDPSSIIDLTATNKGALMPRMTTTQRNAIVSPAHSLLIFNTTTDCFESWNQNTSSWIAFGCIGCNLPGTFSANAASNVLENSFSANWAISAGATSYSLDVSSASDFTSFVSGYNDLNLGNVSTVSVTGLTCGTYYYRVRATNACGTSVNTAIITVVTGTTPTQPSLIAGTTPICQGNTGLAYSVSNLAGLSYTWTYSGSGYSQVSGSTSNSITADFSGAATSGTLTVTPSNGCGDGPSSTLNISVTVPPTIANAGLDISNSCGQTSATLSGNTPTIGTGIWTLVSGTATITTPSSPTSGITGLIVPSTVILSWTISNSPCTASSDDVIIATTNNFTCGTPLAINHTIGSVSPETKTINYGTVTTSLSGASKCWITQNLGSTNQASAATDITDASAGWYWQFNRKQGYTVGPTPAWTITSINETSDWVASEDPCSIELGSCWRIPTYTEWLNADANGVSGGWDDYNETYADVLKLHAAGSLSNSTGSLGGRGTSGLYWSSTESGSTIGWRLICFSGNTTITSLTKAFGASVRCIKD